MAFPIIVGESTIGPRKDVSLTLYVPTIGNVDFNFKKINQVLNRFDIEKDAKIKPSAWNSREDDFFFDEIFYNPKDATFSGINYSTFDLLKKTILETPEFGGVPMRLCLLERPDPQHKKLQAKYIYRDSGFKPSDFSEKYISVYTPGSYIDPGTRKKPGKVANLRIFPTPGRNISLKSDYLDQYGFGNVIEEIHCTTDEAKNCGLAIKTKEAKTNNGEPFLKAEVINKTINSRFEVSPPPNYFTSNAEKNAILKNPHTPMIEKTKYLLGKELGDTLQVLYASVHLRDAMLFDRTLTELDACIFTVDDTVLVRSKLCGLPVAMQEMDPIIGVHVCNYYLPSTNPAELLAQQKKIYMDEAISTNTKLIERIQNVISDGFEYDKEYELTDEGITVFKQLIKIIEHMNKTIYLVRSDSSDTYLLEMKEYTAVEVFKRSSTPNTKTIRIFRTRYEKYDPVYKWCSENGKKFIDYLLLASRAKPKMVSPFKTPPSKRARIETTGGGVEEEDKSITTLFLEAVGGNKDEAEDILLVLYDYLDYVGVTPLNPKIVKYLVDNLDEIQEMSFTEFKDIFYKICDKVINQGIIKKQLETADRAFDEFLHELPVSIEPQPQLVATTAGGGKTRRKVRGKK
jgi:hypothetical protein